MVECIIFDLAETLIGGLLGVDKTLAPELGLPGERVLAGMGGAPLDALFVGAISEDAYLEQIIAREGWQVSPDRLKALIRANFHHEVEGALSILAILASRHPLFLLSDHASEWVAYVRVIHPFLSWFRQTFFSFELGRLKREPETYTHVLQVIGLPPERCLFVDDSPANVALAQSVGMAAIRFVGADQLAAELSARHLWP